MKAVNGHFLRNAFPDKLIDFIDRTQGYFRLE